MAAALVHFLADRLTAPRHVTQQGGLLHVLTAKCRCVIVIVIVSGINGRIFDNCICIGNGNGNGS